MRDAGGGEEIRACVRRAFGVEARTISGQDEARLTLRGGLSGLGLAREQEHLVFDVGGGSTEIVSGHVDAGDVVRCSYEGSFDVGSVRLTERHVKSDPPALAELDAVARDADAAFSRLPRMAFATPPIGVAGTMTTLACVSTGVGPYEGTRVHGMQLSVAELRDVVRRLASVRLDARRAIVGMEPARADVIVAGGIVACSLLEHIGASSIVVSDRGVRWGLALEMNQTVSDRASREP